MTDDQKKALDQYVATVRAHYGARLVDIFVFGSRARGDHHDDSDLDLAVVLEDGDWDHWRERNWLAGETFGPLVEGNIRIQSFPVRRSTWSDPTSHHNPNLVANMKRDAVPLAGMA
jgi:antitoxin ChpS